MSVEWLHKIIDDQKAEIERLRGQVRNQGILKHQQAQRADEAECKVFDLERENARLRKALTKADALLDATLDSDFAIWSRSDVAMIRRPVWTAYQLVHDALSATPVTGQPEGTAQPEAGQGATETGLRKGDGSTVGEADTLTDAEREVIEAAKHYVKMSLNPNTSQFIQESGRRGGSPWAELVDAVKLLDV